MDRWKSLAAALAGCAQLEVATAALKDCALCPEVVELPAGSFVMGDDFGMYPMSPHAVSLRSFAIGVFEVTQGEWASVMGDNPSKKPECGTTCPIDNVSWDDIQEYLKRLERLAGLNYRLPSEAEWEYACLAGGSHTYCGGNDAAKLAWFGKAGGNIHPVGLKQPNAWGLYDMSGNVWEWTADCLLGDTPERPAGKVVGDACPNRVIRGGSWYGRATWRQGLGQGFRAGDIGFRLARDIAPNAPVAPSTQESKRP